MGWHGRVYDGSSKRFFRRWVDRCKPTHTTNENCITLLSLNRRWVAKGFSFDGQFYTDGHRSLRPLTGGWSRKSGRSSIALLAIWADGPSPVDREPNGATGTHARARRKPARCVESRRQSGTALPYYLAAAI